MKLDFLTAGILLVTSILSMPPISIRENPQDTPRGKKTQKHIVIEKIDDNGNKVTLDTLITGNKSFVWNGDTIGGKSAFTWISENGVNADSILKSMTFNFEYETGDEGENKIIVLKSGNGGKHTIHEFVTDGDSNKIFRIKVDTDDFFGDPKVMVWNDDEEGNTFIAPHISGLPQIPDVPKMIFAGKTNSENVIDLTDPSIISYKKKKNRDGTEKITVVRKQVTENKFEKIEEIIMAPGSGSPHVFFSKRPQVNTIKIIKEDGKETKVEVEEETIENN